MASARFRIALAIAVSSVVAVACGSGGATDDLTEAPQPAVTAAPGAVETRELLLQLSGLAVEGGGTFDPNSVAGTNVLVWFWGPH